MMSISRIPGDWPRENTDDYDTEKFWSNSNYVLPERRKTPPTTPYSPSPNLDNQTFNYISRQSAIDQTQPTRRSMVSPVSPITPDELFIPILSSPSVENTSQFEASLPLSPINPDDITIPRRNSRESEKTTAHITPENSLTPQNKPGTSTMSNLIASNTTSPLPQEMNNLYLTTTAAEPYPENLSSQSVQPIAQDELFSAFRTPNAPLINSLQPFHDGIAGDSTYPNLDWIKYEPPNELLKSDSDTSIELKNILLPSIQRIRDREAKDEMSRKAAQAEMILASLNNSSHTTSKPTLSHDPGTMDHLQISSLQRDNEPYTQSSPANSGYRSQPDIEIEASIDTSQSSKARILTGLSGIFRRKNKPRKDVDLIGGNGDFNDQGLSLFRTTSPPSSDIPTQDPSTGECVSCLEDFPSLQLIHLTCHSYCGECFQGLIKTALESETQWPAKCCLNIIPSAKVLSNLDSKSQIKYKQREAEWSIPPGDRVYCARQSCGAWIALKNINKGTNCAKCSKCGYKSCSMCRGKFHNGNECPQDRGVQATLELAEIEGWKRCYRCSALVEHNQGCRHMTCRCKAEFCYICSARWRTCACTDRDLESLRRRAEFNRQNQEAEMALAATEAMLFNQANSREVARLAAIEEEERQILLEVENFIRAEAEREIRAAEEARLAMEEERQRREEARLAAIHLLFKELHDELDGLAWMQLSLLDERHEQESLAWTTDRENGLGTIAVRHSAEIKAQIEKTTKKIAEFQSKFRKEYNIRRAEERRVEDKYVDELRTFWTGKSDAEYKIGIARDELRSERAQDYRYWKSYRRAQLKSLEDGEDMEMAFLLKRHEAEVQDVSVRSEDVTVELKKKKWSENKWFTEVSMERRVMLEELQVQEYAKI